MAMASLKRKWSEIGKPYEGDTDEYYPSLCFDEKQLEALKIDNARVGTEMTMTAIVRVSSVSDSKNGSRSMGFEILEASFEPKEKKPDPASILFPKG